jgi:hypothetical protein
MRDVSLDIKQSFDNKWVFLVNLLIDSANSRKSTQTCTRDHYYRWSYRLKSCSCQCKMTTSILIRYNNLVDKSVACLIVRLLTDPPTWAAGNQITKSNIIDKPEEPKCYAVLVCWWNNKLFLDWVIAVLTHTKISCYASSYWILIRNADTWIRDMVFFYSGNHMVVSK